MPKRSGGHSLFSVQGGSGSLRNAQRAEHASESALPWKQVQGETPPFQ